jgi:hypothetical protein
MTAKMVKRDKQCEPGAIASRVSMGCNNVWMLLNAVLPRAS